MESDPETLSSIQHREYILSAQDAAKLVTVFLQEHPGQTFTYRDEQGAAHIGTAEHMLQTIASANGKIFSCNTHDGHILSMIGSPMPIALDAIGVCIAFVDCPYAAAIHRTLTERSASNQGDSNHLILLEGENTVAIHAEPADTSSIASHMITLIHGAVEKGYDLWYVHDTPPTGQVAIAIAQASQWIRHYADNSFVNNQVHATLCMPMHSGTPEIYESIEHILGTPAGKLLLDEILALESSPHQEIQLHDRIIALYWQFFFEGSIRQDMLHMQTGAITGIHLLASQDALMCNIPVLFPQPDEKLFSICILHPGIAGQVVSMLRQQYRRLQNA